MQERSVDQQFFKDAMTTLSFKLEESLKKDVNLLAEYLTRRLESKSSAGAVARAFIASGLEQMRHSTRIYGSFWNSDESRITIRPRFRKQREESHRRVERKAEILARESDPVPPKRLPPQKPSTRIDGYDSIVSGLVDLDLVEDLG